jgi:hypothetical protein
MTRSRYWRTQVQPQAWCGGGGGEVLRELETLGRRSELFFVEPRRHGRLETRPDAPPPTELGLE